LAEQLVTISARVRRSQAVEIQRLADERGVDRSAVFRELLSRAMRERRLEEALDLVRRRKVTVWRAAEIAEVTYREMLEALRAHNVPFPLSEEELGREIKEIFPGE
jgi:predicted HTH domain antitoxin